MKKSVKTLIWDFCKFETFPQDFFLETVETRDRDRDQAFETKTKILKSWISCRTFQKLLQRLLPDVTPR